MPELTPKLGIKKPLGNETVSRAVFNENWDIIDQNTIADKGGVPSIQAGPDASKPTPGTAGRLYVATDTQIIYRDTGTAWAKVGVVKWGDIEGKPSAFLPTVHGNEAHDPDLALASDLAAHLADDVKHITSAERDSWNAKETPSGAQAKVDAHANATSVHSATSAATANRIMMRDSYGRAKVAAPSASDDIARKDTVDAVQTNLNIHKTSSDHDGRYYTESEVNTLLDGKMSNTKVYGNVTYTDSIAAGATLTKNIALGGTYKHGIAVIHSTQKAPSGIIVFFGTDNTKTLVVGTIDLIGDIAGAAWSRNIINQITKSDGPAPYYGKLCTGSYYIDILDVYISGSNLIIVFKNITTSNDAMYCNIYWEVW